MEDLGTRLALSVRAFYWPESVRLRVALGVVAGAWLLIASQAASAGPESGLFVASWWDATLTWAAVRLAVTDRDGQLAPRLPLTWRGTRLGRLILPWQLGLSAAVLIGDLINWSGRTRLATATNDLDVTLFLATVVWATPAVLVALTCYPALLSSLVTWPEVAPRAGQESWLPPQEDMPRDPSWQDWEPRTAPPPPPEPEPEVWEEYRPGGEAAGDEAEPEPEPEQWAEDPTYAMPLDVAYMLTGLTAGASAAEIAQRRRALMKQTHTDPDRVHLSPAEVEARERKTARLLEAFEVIMAHRKSA